MADYGSAVPDFGTKSHTRRDVKLTILGTDDSLTLPVETTTKVIEVKALLAHRLGLDIEQMALVVKKASSCRTQLDMEEVGRSCIVRGIRSWVKEKNRYPYPMCIVGAGHYGLRQALSFLKEDIRDFTLYDRLEKVGGTAWVRNANPTSKLQTELGVYHLQYDFDYPGPKGLKTWPSRDELLEHFHGVAAEYGILPHVVLNTSVTEVTVVTDNETLPFYSPKRQHLEVATSLKPSLQDAAKPADEAEAAGREPAASEALFSCISYFPGGLVENQRVEYKGEDTFVGQIGYGMFNEFDYSVVKGKVPAIIGFGAFGVENVRTCLEHGAAKTLIVCRRKNLAMPRVISWFINQSLFPPPASMLLDAMQKMYDLIPDDAWGYYGVNASADRSMCSIRQKSRFGISDVYFLASYYKRVEVYVDTIKRIRPRELMLEGGDKVRADHLIKVLGFKGDFSVDKILGIREMVGNFVNGDWSRFVAAEFPGIDAGKFGGTSFSPKGQQDAEFMSWFINYPRDLEPIFAARVLPRKKADKSGATPTYVWDPRAGMSISMAISGGMIPGLAELGNRYGPFNRQRMLELHPAEQFVDKCAEEWTSYCKMFKDADDDRPFPPYPYTKEFVKELCERNDREGEEEMARQVARMT